MIFIDILSFSCPLMLCAMGALFSDYAGILAIFLEGLICFSAYLMFYFTTITSSAAAGVLLTVIVSLISVFIFAFIIEKTKANPFIAATAINLLFAALPSFFASVSFKTRGVLFDERFVFPVLQTKLITIFITALILSLSLLFLLKTKPGLYLRITGSDSDVLIAKGVDSVLCRISSWLFAAFFASFAGIFLCMRISSFVPNISSGRGWMALAAVYLGKKNPWKISIAVLIFCAADFFATSIQNFLPAVPTSVVLALPYLVTLLLISLEK